MNRSFSSNTQVSLNGIGKAPLFAEQETCQPGIRSILPSISRARPATPPPPPRGLPPLGPPPPVYAPPGGGGVKSFRGGRAAAVFLPPPPQSVADIPDAPCP